MPGLTDLEFRTATPADAGALRALHAEAYGRPRSLAHWRWRYVDNPLGETSVFGAFRPDGRCVAAHCGTGFRFRLGGDDAVAMVHGDVAVAPDLGLARGRVLARVSGGFFERFGGGGVALVWGFPMQGLRRVLVRHNRCEVFQDVVLLVRDLERVGPHHGGAEPAGLELFTRRAAEIDALGALPFAAADAVGTRIDAAWLEWRFARHPDVAYRPWIFERGGRLAGLAITRDGGLAADTVSIVEFLAAPGDHEAAAALLGAATGEARRLGRRFVVTWLAGDRWQHDLQVSHGCFAEPTAYQQVGRVWRAGLDRDRLARTWRRSLADLDFV